MINERAKVIICRGCDRGVPHEHLETHVSKKHKINCSHNTVQLIVNGRQLMSLDSITEFKSKTKELESAIEGIPVRHGYKCIKCGHCVRKWRSMTNHFSNKHKGEDAKEWSEGDIEMQLVFGGVLKKWFPIRDRSTVEVEDDNESAWKAVEVLLAKRKRRASRLVNEREENVRLINGFVARTRWDILIEGHDKKALMGLAALAKEKDPLRRIGELSQKYFESISDKLRVGDVLLRRKIQSEGYVIAIS
jgi:Orsellinic acid/F9775 biosynthesis cluster protein D